MGGGVLVLWKACLGLSIAWMFGRIAGRFLHYAILALFLFILLVVVIAAAVILNAHVTHAYHQAAWTLAERRQDMFEAIEFLTTTPCSLPRPDEGWPSDWRSVSRGVRAHMSPSRLPYHFMVDGYSVHSGLPTAQEVATGQNTIVLYSGGSWAGVNPSQVWINAVLALVCGCTSTAQLSLRAAKNLRLPVPVVGFNYGTSHLDTLNIGQADDSAILSFVYKAVTSAHPTARIVLFGDCLGSLRLLNWVASRPELPHLEAIVLESPLPSLRKFLSALTPFDSCNYVMFRALVTIMPNYRPELEDYQSFLAYGKDSFPDVPTFIGLLRDDPISHPRDLPQFQTRLHQLEVFVADDKDSAGRPVEHGHIIKLATYQQAVRAFLRRLHLIDDSHTGQQIDPHTAQKLDSHSCPAK
jgi:hypothetical protein